MFKQFKSVACAAAVAAVFAAPGAAMGDDQFYPIPS